MKADIKAQTCVTRRFEIQLTREDIITAVKQEMKASGNSQMLNIPDSAEVEFYVPGGADWSNTSIEIDDENPVIVTWTEEESSGSLC